MKVSEEREVGALFLILLIFAMGVWWKTLSDSNATTENSFFWEHTAELKLEGKVIDIYRAGKHHFVDVESKGKMHQRYISLDDFYSVKKGDAYTEITRRADSDLTTVGFLSCIGLVVIAILAGPAGWLSAGLYVGALLFIPRESFMIPWAIISMAALLTQYNWLSMAWFRECMNDEESGEFFFIVVSMPVENDGRVWKFFGNLYVYKGYSFYYKEDVVAHKLKYG